MRPDSQKQTIAITQKTVAPSTVRLCSFAGCCGELAHGSPLAGTLGGTIVDKIGFRKTASKRELGVNPVLMGVGGPYRTMAD
jgi:hypothetical protein